MPCMYKFILLGWCIFHSDFVSYVGILGAMGLFIDCHFLFEVQLLDLSLHIKVLSFGRLVELWTLENGVPSGEIGTFLTYSFSLSSVERRKQRRQPQTFAPCMGTMPSEIAWLENGFLVLRRIF